MIEKIDTVDILGVKFANIDSHTLLNIIKKAFNSNSHDKIVIYFTSVNSLNFCFKVNEYREILNRATIVTADSYGVILASKIKRTPLIEQISTDRFEKVLFPYLNMEKKSIFLVGSTEKVNIKARFMIKQKYPNIVVSGGVSPFGEIDEIATSEIISAINSYKPDVILVSLGNPKQEQWIDKCAPLLNSTIIMNAGGFMDYIAGEATYAPTVFHSLHLVWLFRLFLNPKKFWKRYLIGNPLFLLRILFYKSS